MADTWGRGPGDIAVHPVYVIISQQGGSGAPFLFNYGLPRIILDVVECDVTDIPKVFDERVYPLMNAGAQINTTIFSREPDSALRNWHSHPAPDPEKE